MSRMRDNDFDEQYSVVEDEAEVRFLDFEDESVRNFNPLLDEGPVIISMPFPLSRGKPQSALVGETVADVLTIKNTMDEAVELWSARIYSSNPKDSYLLSLMPPPEKNSDEDKIQSFVGSTELEDRVLQPEETLNIWISCTPEEVGIHTAVIHIAVGDEKLERVAFILADDQISQSLASSKPFMRSQRKKKFSTDGYVPASHPSKPVKHEFRFSLPRFPIPCDLRDMIENHQIPNILEESLNRKNYAAFFSTLLIMEEIYLEEQMRGYDMECAVLTRKRNNLMSLVVHGLAEKRPSLVYGDSLFAKSAFDDSNKDPGPFQGYIGKTNAEEIYIAFAPSFYRQHNDSKRYDITFCQNRLSMRKLHLAVQIADENGSDILFPCNKRTTRPVPNPVIPFNNTLNQEQILSVEKILACHGSPPYIIHGPPGTGKTVTVVEAILQICRRNPKSRILVCAPSNSAADHILEKLISSKTLNSSKIFRLNAPSRPYEDLNPDHIQYCFLDGLSFQCPPLGALLRYSVIISTYMSSYQLYSQGLRQGHFGYIFLDEAGQASEPETMVPLMGLCTRKSTVVLAGDPKQLGPVVCSTDANRLGLGKSYLQRLFDFDFYANHDADYMTKLVRNYRSHGAILSLPSSLFYKGELIACREEREDSTLDFLSLPNKEFPILFMGVQGCDEREGSSPSWFNRTEVSKVVEMIRRLKSIVDFSESNIGVITPYLQQAVKLRKAFDSVEITDVKVGSVEQFQGQEREVIILSTVRSTVKHNEFDRVHSLGFLTNPRRFTVAITRARSLLVIIGNPHVIAKDPFWEKLLRYCVDNGSYQGCPLPEPEIGHQDPQTRVSEWVSDWDESLPSQYSNEVAWDEQLPNHGSNELPIRSQYSNEVAWDEQLPSQGSKELPVPNPYSNEVAWDEELPSHGLKELPVPNPYSNEFAWDEELPSHGLKELPVPNTYSNEVAWDEELPMHGLPELPSHSSWDEELLSHESKELPIPIQNSWDEVVPSHRLQELPSHQFTWDEELPSRGSKEPPLPGQNSWGEEILGQKPDTSQWKEKIPNQYSNRREIEGECMGGRRKGKKNKGGCSKPVSSWKTKAPPLRPSCGGEKPVWRESKRKP